MYLQYMNCSIASLHAILHTRHVTRQFTGCIVTKGKQRALSLKVACHFRLYFKIGRGGQLLNRVEITEYSRATTIVYTQEYPITLPMVGMGQIP